MTRLIQSFASTVGDTWCQLIHPDPMWPVNGVYQCRVCQRKFPVAWEQSAIKPVDTTVPSGPAREHAMAARTTLTQSA